MERMAAKGKEMTATMKHDDWLFEQLQDAQFAAEFINAAIEDDDPKTYLTALRKVVEARGGMASVAQKTDLSRETLYRTLSSRGNLPHSVFSWQPHHPNTERCA